jgi:hypothetical protein
MDKNTIVNKYFTLASKKQLLRISQSRFKFNQYYSDETIGGIKKAQSVSASFPGSSQSVQCMVNAPR